MVTNPACSPDSFETVDSPAVQKNDKTAVTPVRNESATQCWLEENKRAVEAYNVDVWANGVWSDGLRCW